MPGRRHLFRSQLALLLAMLTGLPCAHSQDSPDPSSRDLRAGTRWALSASYAPASFPLPQRLAAGVQYLPSARWTFELQGSIGLLPIGVLGLNLASARETALAIRTRWYGSFNSFHLIGGMGYRHLRFGLARSEFEPRLRAGLIELGLGNRWLLGSGAVIGVDWLTLGIPLLASLETESVPQDLRSTFRVLNRFPTVTLLAISVGYTF